MSLLQASILAFVAVVGTGVVLTRDIRNQTIVLGFYGLLLALMFTVFQAPDVALSQLVVGAVALPLLMLLAIAKVRAQARARKRRERDREQKR